jgi:hypothetical protein
MATLDDVPQTEELLRPILETLGVQDGPMKYWRLVGALYRSLGLPHTGSYELREILAHRVGEALWALEDQRAVQGIGWFMRAWKRWAITEYGRGLTDHDLASALQKYSFGPSGLPSPEPPPGIGWGPWDG